ncbi:5317_t:CDS:1 [Paraglomus occultum]|uniref:5317_t:CDS:1 n=1 Tax=Paraglomus occultum TaxID=144539 RepID=A0A9N8VSA6_9GLOM|nr:5317_t:CDS:1 [Paraglomus occultum]
MTIRENNIILINSKGQLIDNKGEEDPKQLPFKLPSEIPGLPDNCGGTLCLKDVTFAFVSRKSRLLIRKPYLQLIEVLEDDRANEGKAEHGCAIVGTAGIGKTYFGLYFLFYITRHYPDSDIVWQNPCKCLLFSPNHPAQKGKIDDFEN